MTRKLYKVVEMRRTCPIQYDRDGLHHTGWEVFIPRDNARDWHDPANWWPEYESADGQPAYLR